MRADKYFAHKFGSRTKAAQALRKGIVLQNGKPISPDTEVREGDAFFFLQEESFASNGGYKLARGLDFFHESVAGKVYADLGASTGGFTDCLLRRGAKHVFCVDVGESLLAPFLCNDSRVTVMDHTNARYLTADDFSLPLAGVVCDLSFISLRLVLPTIFLLLPEGGDAFVLFKPQFECGKGGIGKSGICPQRLHPILLEEFYDFCCALGMMPQNIINAPIREKKNIEYMIHLKRGGMAMIKQNYLNCIFFKKN